MKKACFYWFSFLLPLLLMTSCRSYKPAVITEKTTEKITETVHDTIFKTEKDSSSYQALLDCINGKVVVKEVTKASPGKHLSAPKVKIVDNKLDVDCEARAQELFASWKSKETLKDAVIEKPVFIENELTFLEELQIWTGRILFCLLILIFIFWIVKKQINAYRLKI